MTILSHHRIYSGTEHPPEAHRYGTLWFYFVSIEIDEDIASRSKENTQSPVNFVNLNKKACFTSYIIFGISAGIL